ncbi:tail assembly protein [Pseudomonas sp. SDI]|uniref:tail assembly protein n=1 Tax=Pseudomonas sp. SDI TaxID=2170734 RepID=UPI000DE716BF|nr:tail assembly protein [Pseudomonas sp. SDI]PWB33745.1 tail assembly protein [Pseudomonas sp. SDI]
MSTLAINYTPKTRIILGGFLGKKYGKEYNLLLGRGDPREAVRALDANFPGLAKDIADAQLKGLRFAVFKNGKNIGEDELDLGGAKELKFVPVIHGSKRAGLLQTIIGIALIIASPFTGGATMAPGIALAAGGVVQMLSPQVRGLSNSAAPENTPSYAFGSAKNTTASGNPVPICIGRRRWGGAIISAGIYAEDQM